MAGDVLIVWVTGGTLAIAATLPFLIRHRRRERAAAHAEAVAHRHGLGEPASLHPVVKAELCIGTGNCISACPEGDVLGLRDGQARPISPARCVGHGLCERACPVEAIQLVFGTEKRGVDIPRIRGNFETNVPGIYVIGELGGMGLVRNAFEQGRQCIEGIRRETWPGPDGALDAVVVGCGPAGLSAALNCLHHGLNFVCLEKEDIGGTVRYYPRKKIVMTAPVNVPGYGRLRFRELCKEELIALWGDIIAKTGLAVNTGETVSGITPLSGGEGFEVKSTKRSYTTKRVILAIGRRGVPRKLGVPGESLPKISYSLLEPEAFQNDRMLVVGGGDSAVEAALALAQESGNTVAISYRRDRFARLKPANLERVERAAGQGRIDVLWSTDVVAIAPDSVVYRDRAGHTHSLGNDYVTIFIGGELPTAFLEHCGIAIDTKFGRP